MKEYINDNLIRNLRNLSHTMRSLYEGRGSQKRILIVLKETGTITQRELTERLGIKPGSASEVLSKLESAGLIVRIPSETDRRTASIGLTKAGTEAADAARTERDKRHEEMFSCLTDGEKEELLSLLTKVSADWEIRYQDVKGRESSAVGRNCYKKTATGNGERQLCGTI